MYPSYFSPSQGYPSLCAPAMFVFLLLLCSSSFCWVGVFGAQGEGGGQEQDPYSRIGPADCASLLARRVHSFEDNAKYEELRGACAVRAFLQYGKKTAS
ncbi:unnamed protein product, partial [Amoebophrya sp. A25]|eukprot:GSA25T00012518001.1